MTTHWEPNADEVDAYIAAARAEHRRVVDTVTGMDYEQRRDQIAAAGLRAAYRQLQRRMEHPNAAAVTDCSGERE